MRSEFPAKIDSFEEKLDPKESDINSISRWESLQKKESKSAEEVLEYQNLTAYLAKMIFTAEDYNKLADAIVATQDFFNKETVVFIDALQAGVEEYVDTMKSDAKKEMDAHIAQFEHRGQYSSLENYKKYNTAQYMGSTYWCKKDCIGVVPTNEDYWVLASSMGAQGIRGEKGDDGLNLIYKGIYDPESSYDESHLVTYGGQIYHNILPSTGVIPTNTSNWELAIQKGSSTSLRYFRSTVNSDAGVSEVFINIANYNPSTDTLLVYIDGNLARVKEDYSVVDNSKVNLVDSSTAHEVDFILFKNVLTETNYAMSIYSGITFLASNWSLNQQSGLYENVLSDTRLSNAMKVDVNFSDVKMLDKAMECGVMPYTEETKDGVKIFSKNRPDIDLVASIVSWVSSV